MRSDCSVQKLLNFRCIPRFFVVIRSKTMSEKLKIHVTKYIWILYQNPCPKLVVLQTDGLIVAGLKCDTHSTGMYKVFPETTQMMQGIKPSLENSPKKACALIG